MWISYCNRCGKTIARHDDYYDRETYCEACRKDLAHEAIQELKDQMNIPDMEDERFALLLNQITGRFGLLPTKIRFIRAGKGSDSYKVWLEDKRQIRLSLRHGDHIVIRASIL